MKSFAFVLSLLALLAVVAGQNATLAPEVFDDLGACLRGALDIIKCGDNTTECTCFDDLFNQQGEAQKVVNEDATCDEISAAICGLVEKAKSCCVPCEATVSRAAICADENHVLKTKNCTRAQECAVEGLESGAISASSIGAILVAAFSMFL
ncbi:expressed unknown protein [Seminavis robusta]|uniref:Uncharacterized protein n=1 Tax=Seminavis robusta TaxID=568900 RepID=A0A9N8HPN6_9STRA|nr:expressed unknown protein [Seminavis robusta]|eukprot:Sro1109_g242260.1 n/a (152) ;mRNA; r:10921-11521